MIKNDSGKPADTFDNDIFEDDFSAEDTPESQPEEAPQKEKKPFRFGRFLVILVIAVFVLVNAWAFVDMLQFELLVVSVEVNRDSIAVFENETHTLYAEVKSYGLSETLGLSSPEVVWKSSDTTVALVSSDGTIQAVAPGRAVITAAEARSGLSAECTITVHSLTDIILNVTEKHVGAGEEIELEAAVSSNDMAEPFTYASSDDSVATVDEQGVVTTVGSGQAVITVSARGYTESDCVVSVSDAPTAFIFASEQTNICLGEKRTIGVVLGEGEYSSSYTYSSSNPNVIEIDENGRMEAMSEGTAVITVSAFNGVENSIEYTVVEAPRKLTLEEQELELYSAFTYPLLPVDDTGSCGEYYYTSSNPEVASVDKDGIITAHNRGEAEIVCTSYNGKSVSCNVTVIVVCYTVPYSYDRVEQNIAALAASYPELISTEQVGSSVMGRNITLVKLGRGEKKALIVAGLHSRENITVSFTMRCIEEYAEAYYSKTGKYGTYNIKDMLDSYTLYIVPLLNPDGLDISTGDENPLYTTEEIDRAKFKNNANGVNLNRNFPFMWGYSDEEKTINVTTPDAESYAGTEAASEPETQAMITLCRSHEFEWFLDIHCRGNMIYYQDDFNEVGKADNQLAYLLSRRCGFNLMGKSDGYAVSGGFENWFRSEFGKPGICVELVNSNYSYIVNESFDEKLNWSKTKYTFLMGMTDLD